MPTKKENAPTIKVDPTVEMNALLLLIAQQLNSINKTLNKLLEKNTNTPT